MFISASDYKGVVLVAPVTINENGTQPNISFANYNV